MARIVEWNGDKEELNMEDRLVLGVRDLWRVVIRPRRMRDGPVATNGFVEEGDGRFGIVGEIFDTGCGNGAFKFLRGWRKRPTRVN